MMRIILILFLLISTNVWAGDFACWDSSTHMITRTYKSVDGSDLTLLPNCMKISRTQYDALPEIKWAKEENGQIIEISQAEKDAIAAAEAATAQAAEDARIAALDTQMSDAVESDAILTKVDAKIDAIANLADAKVFLKRLMRYLVK